MSRRLYYDDAYTTQFHALVVALDRHEGRPAVVLDRTYFYPISGGQPHDAGRLSQGATVARVVSVFADDSDDRVLHVLDVPLSLGPVSGVVDWSRRFDHMQHHTGQHILSQAFVRVAGAETVSFHLSGQSVTVDLDRPLLAPGDLDAAERLANEIVWQNRAVRITMVTLEEAARLPLRKRPPTRDGRLRLVEVDDFDLNACGGTHVAHTGEVGLIKLLKVERRGEVLRVEFCCGGRALADYGLKHDIARRLAATLTTGYEDLAPAVERLQEETRSLRREAQRQGAQLRRMEAEALLAGAAPLGDARLVRHVFRDRRADELRQLAGMLAEQKGVIALLGLAGANAQLVFARSADAPGTMGELIKPALAVLGEARGGGGSTLAQGGGPAADDVVVAAALDSAAERLRQSVMAVE